MRKFAKVDPSPLEDFIDAGFTVIPLEARGKRPIHKKWTSHPYNSRKVVAKHDGNFGLRLCDVDLVLDVDARRDGVAGLEKLCADLGLNLDAVPRTNTGGGGFHYFFRKPAGIRVVDSLKEFPGVEFKSLGRQVVGPGSVHPSGRRYELEFTPLTIAERPDAPKSLLELIERPAAPEGSRGGGELLPEQAAELLALLPAENFASNEAWFELMCAVHHGTGGEAREEFLDWSETDPTYSDKRHVNGSRWDSLTVNPAESQITVATFYKALRDAGHGDKVPARDGAADFDGDEIDEAHDAVPNPDGFKVRDGKVVATSQGNIRLALRKLGVRVRYDSFADRYLIEGLKGFGPYLDDAAMNHLRLSMDENFKFLVPKELFFDVVFDIARHKSFHPVRDHLDSLEWDGSQRLATWLIRHAGAADTPYVRAVSELVLIAAVRRIRKPGAKFDEMMVLESTQGTDKSSALAIMAVKAEWFTDAFPLNADDKRVIETLNGKWIIEAAELKGMRRGEIEHIKAMLSRQVDRARMTYGRTPIERPRQCIIIGTTNSDAYLRDTTGNRRFWPVKVGRFDLAGLKAERDMLWAEAAAREAEGASIRLDRELWAEAAKVQKLRTVTDPFADTFRAILGKMEGKILCEDAWRVLGIPAGHRTQDHNARFGSALAELGWKRKRRRFKGKPAHCYVRGSEPLRLIRVEVGTGPRAEVHAYHAEECSDE